MAAMMPLTLPSLSALYTSLPVLIAAGWSAGVMLFFFSFFFSSQSTASDCRESREPLSYWYNLQSFIPKHSVAKRAMQWFDFWWVKLFLFSHLSLSLTVWEENSYSVILLHLLLPAPNYYALAYYIKILLFFNETSRRWY